MGLLSPSVTEHEYYSDSLAEALSLIGQEAKLYQVKNKSFDFYSDPTVELDEAIDLNILFESNPTPVLKREKWQSEEDYSGAYVVYLTAKVRDKDKEITLIPITLEEGMIIKVEPVFNMVNDSLLEVSRIRGNHINPWVFMCKLVPYREDTDFKPETEEVDSNILEDGEKVNNKFNYLKK